ncbi:MAG: tetratricopeptide repeat protein [bacterium]|nr:tetratricopeptide repeat protein [bacterium]
MTLQGTRVRQFRIMESLGEGGMGDVYLGYDEKLNRKVALKVLRKEHRLRPEAKARLLREARLLSQLDHPHICRIYDFVEEDDAEFLVLELIEGQSLRQVFKEGIEERQAMQIALEVAGVLVAAHGQGVVHRDLKPENVMITPEGRVKVLDFGIARSIKKGAAADGSEPADKSVAEMSVAARPAEAMADTLDSETRTFTLADTALGSVTGTVAYMSPEQARSEPISAASDMYSFGLLLQELFTGKSPYAKQSSPALLLVKASRAETLPVAGVDADLAALIERLKSLEPAARPAALDAAERLEWIREKPRLHRLRRLKIAAVVFLALIAAVTTFLTIRVGRERDRANREATRANREAARANQEARRANHEAEAAREVSEFLVNLFEVSNPSENRGNTITAREILDRGAARIDQELAGQPMTQARLMHTISTVYRHLALNDEALRLGKRALEIREELLPADAPDIAENLRDIATVQRLRQRFSEAEELYNRALSIQEKVLDGNHPDLAATLTQLGILYWYQGRHAEAEPLLRRAEKIYEGKSTVAMATIVNALGFIYLHQGRYDETEARFRQSLEIRNRIGGADHPELAFALNGLAILEYQRGRYAESETAYKRALAVREAALGKDHPWMAWILEGLGLLYYQQGRYAAAEQVYQRAVTIAGDAPSRSLILVGLGGIHKARARYGEAERLSRQALELWEGSMGEDRSESTPFLLGLAECYAMQERYDEAEGLFQRVLAIREDPTSAAHPLAAADLNRVADFYLARGRYAQASSLYRRAREIEDRTLDAIHPDVARTLNGMAGIAAAEDRPAEAEPLYNQALAIRRQILGRDHPDVAVSLRNLGRLYLVQGRHDEAEPSFERALEIRSALYGPRHPAVIESRSDLEELRRATSSGEPPGDQG